MKFAILLIAFIQVLCCRAGRKQTEETPLTSPACNDPEVELAADLSIDELNDFREDGFVLGIKRISNVQEHNEEGKGTVYYLTLDVYETECHVQSKEHWKDCKPKPRHEAVSGECRVIFHVDKPQEIANLIKYDCTLTPANEPFPCLGCPMTRPLNDTRFHSVANKGLKKFNKDNNFDNFFALGNITKGTIQVVAGAIYKVEFLIHESNCNKSTSSGDPDLCPPSDSESAHTGYCKSKGISHFSRPADPVVTITCKVFEPEVEK